MELLKFVSKGTGFWILSGLLLAVFAVLGIIVYKSSRREYIGRIMIPVFLIELGILFGTLALGFPKQDTDAVGPAVVPLLWIVGIFVLAVFLLFRGLTGLEEKDPPWGRVDVVVIYFIITIFYVIIMQVIGYTASTLFYLISGMYYLGYRKWRTMLSISFGWILFSYFAFYRLLFVPLPKGILIERIFG